jgi:hypothetical protein
MDKILKDSGLKYEELNEQEKETYRQQNFQLQSLTAGDVLQHVRFMKDGVALQLCDVPDDTLNRDKNSKLKARLKNYIVMEAFLSTPEKAEQAIRNALKNAPPK